MEGKVNLWTLESLTTTSGMGSQSASIVTSMNIWQRNTSQKRKKTSNNALNMIKKGI